MPASDPLTLIAFIVSIAAFIAASLQVIQQYAATAYDFRRCSRRTIGGWARHTKRRFLWAEVRFEITYSVPHISLDFENIGGSLIPSHVYPTYSFAPVSSRRMRYKWEDDPWFLRVGETVPEARCSWLSLLEDTSMTILPFHISEQRRSYDFLPRDVMRPIATADRKSFLVLMTLLQVKWNGRGIGGATGGGAFVGTGPNCEISATYVPSFGTVYTYHRREPFQKYGAVMSSSELPLYHKEECLPVQTSFSFFQSLFGQGTKFKSLLKAPQPSLRYSLPKFWRHWLHLSFNVGDQQLNAVQSMFNHFDLSFMILRTWSPEEVQESLLRAFSDHKLASTVVEHYPIDGFYPGLGELVACWGYPSTPRVIDPLFGTYSSIYSASDLRCALGIPLAASILLGNETQLQSMGLSQYESLNTLREWSTRYWHQLLVPAEHMFKCRAWISHLNMNLDVNILHDVKIDVKTGDACLELIELLDMELTRSYPSAIRHRDLARCILQVYSQSHSNSESLGISPSGHSPLSQVVTMANNVIEVVRQLSADHPEYPEEDVQMIVINRLLRGVLWTIRNGNAPGNRPSKSTGEDRSFECSLSSRILESTETIYIS